jgi:16S rRNA U516 pseudouridylate synthase RsuA-like enzyme
VRVAIGQVALGELGKGQWRPLTGDEVRILANAPAKPSR